MRFYIIIKRLSGEISSVAQDGNLIFGVKRTQISPVPIISDEVQMENKF